VEDLTIETMTALYQSLSDTDEVRIKECQRYIWGIAKNKLYSFYSHKKSQAMTVEDIDTEALPHSLEADFLDNYRSLHFQQFYEKLQQCIQNVSDTD